MKKRNVLGLLTVGLITGVLADDFGSGANEFEIEFALMGNAGNAADVGGYGDVAYNYKIGRYEVAVEQFSKAWNLDSRISDGNEDYWESELGAWAPAVNVSWQEAAKFCNWLTSGDAYAGAYTVSGGVVTGVDRAAAVTTYGLVYVIPTEDEWYKAAYHTGSGYSAYANGTSTIPVKGPEGANYEYYYPYPGKPWVAWQGGGEHNATHNMNGNVWESCEDGVDWLIRGGAFDEPARDRKDKADQFTEAIEVGFRVAAIGSGITIDRAVEHLNITKTRFYRQTGAASTTASGATLNVSVSGENHTAYYPAGPVSFAGPAGTTSMQFNGSERRFEEEYTSVTSMNSAQPNGPYVMNLAGTNLALNLSPETYPIVPVCSSSAGSWVGGRLRVSATEASAGFALSSTSSTENGFLSIELNDEDWEMELRKFETHPSATSVSLDVPAGELEIGVIYTVEVEFDHVVDNADAGFIDAGARAFALYSSQTSFEIEVVDDGGGTPGGGDSLTHVGGDDFNDNVLDLGWVEWHADPGAFFTETNQRLEYTCPGGGEKFVGWSWGNNSLPATEDWAVSIEIVHLYDTSALTPSQEFEFNLVVGNGTNVVALKYGNYAGSMVMRTEVADFISDQVTYSSGVPVVGNQATVRITYDAVLQTLTTAYSAGGGFVDLDTVSVSAWGLTATSELEASIMVDNEFLSISAGEVYADNFCIFGVSGSVVPPEWKALHFPGGYPGDLVDNDGDGLDNRSEFIAGTSPVAGRSVFAATNAAHTPQGFVFSWNSVSGRIYSVEWTDSLTNSFQTLETGITHPQNSYTDTVHATESGGFYNLKVKLED